MIKCTCTAFVTHTFLLSHSDIILVYWGGRECNACNVIRAKNLETILLNP